MTRKENTKEHFWHLFEKRGVSPFDICLIWSHHIRDSFLTNQNEKFCGWRKMYRSGYGDTP